MKNKLWLLCLSIFLIYSCTHFEITNEIQPTVIIMDDIVGLKYKIGDLLVMDELNDLNSKHLEYIKHHKNKLTLGLKIIYNNALNSDTSFTYYLGGIEIESNINVIRPEVLLKNRVSIENFIIIKLSGNPPKNEVNHPTEELIKEGVKKEATSEQTPFKKL